MNPPTGIEIKVAIIDHDDVNDDGGPQYYTTSQHMFNHELARKSNRDLLEETMEICANKVIREWREQYED